ncbi:LPS assembly lipoprotein LptE [Sphingobium sp. RAC03]|uniref:LPS assembly lipoprotein LptE n=1 Tax=Sphingobium sp. RAC03 TaxID=1843368 RepID=UPI00083E08AF|nr:LPS assembly lipoprotein LptE [Sphingobium sp. RAC03]AOF98121.1 lipopolysaccharide-assembly family protein [Sphingobium sp. RAC03]
MKRLLLLLAIPLLLTGCGLRPVYGGGTQGAVAQALGNVDVAPIEGRGGWLVRNALNDRLGAMSGGSGPRYKLVVKLDDQITGFGLRADAAVTRERRTLRARYQLIDEATGAQILDDTAGSDAGIDVTSSEYATIAAEDTALERLSQTVADQIVTRLALFSRKAANP